MPGISTAGKFSRGKLKTSSPWGWRSRERRVNEEERLRRRVEIRRRHDKGGRCELWLLGNLTAPPVFVRNLKTLYSPGMAMAADDRVQIVCVCVSADDFERVLASR